MLWVGVITAAATLGVLGLLLALATRVDHADTHLIGDGSLLGRDDLRSDAGPNGPS